MARLLSTLIVTASLAAGRVHADVLYSVDLLQQQLVTLDTETGAVTQVAFLANMNLVTLDLAYLDGKIYAVEQFGPGLQLITIDPENGAIALSVQVRLDDENIGRATGLAVHDGGLLLGFTPDPRGNRATHLGLLQADGSITDAVSYEAMDADFHGLAAAPDGESFFSVDSGFTNDLYRATLDPPQYTFVGGGEFGAVNDLALIGDELWALASIAQDFSDLLRLDAETGEVLETIAIDVFPGQSLFTGLARVPCVGDLDANANVGFGDLLILLASWGVCESCPADLDGSGAVDFGDLLLLLAAWGSC